MEKTRIKWRYLNMEKLQVNFVYVLCDWSMRCEKRQLYINFFFSEIGYASGEHRTLNNRSVCTTKTN